MSEYTKTLYDLINQNRFIRCFYGKCPDCGKRIFSVDEEVVDGDKIRARFVCECGKKYKETVYSRKMGRYRYPQALAETVRDKKLGLIRVLRLKDRQVLVTKEKIRYRKI